MSDQSQDTQVIERQVITHLLRTMKKNCWNVYVVDDGDDLTQWTGDDSCHCESCRRIATVREFEGKERKPTLRDALQNLVDALDKGIKS